MAYLDVQVSLDGVDAATNDAVRGDGSYARARAAMDHLAAAGFGPFKISVVVTRHNVDQLDALQGARRRLRRPAARHPAAAVGPRRRLLARPPPDPGPAAHDLPLAARPRRRGAHRRQLLPPQRPRPAAARAQPVRRRARRLPHRPASATCTPVRSSSTSSSAPARSAGPGGFTRGVAGQRAVPGAAPAGLRRGVRQLRELRRLPGRVHGGQVLHRDAARRSGPRVRRRPRRAGARRRRHRIGATAGGRPLPTRCRLRARPPTDWS